MEFVPIKKRTLSDKVREHLYEYIKTMDLNSNTKLPSEDLIAQNLGVSRITIRKALTDLETNGIVFRVHGKGTFVNPEALQLKVNITNGFEVKQMIEDSGYKADVEILYVGCEPCNIETAKNLKINEGDEIVKVEKLFYADGKPAVFCIDRFPKSEINESVCKEDMIGSIFKYMIQKTGKIVTWDKSSIRCATKESLLSLSKNISKLQNDALLVFNVKNYEQQNNIVLYNTEIYDTNFINFNVIRQKKII